MDNAAKATVYGEKEIVELGGLSDLYSNPILDPGTIVGLWEYDPEAAAIVGTTFVAADKTLREAVDRTQAYTRDQLGDAPLSAWTVLSAAFRDSMCCARHKSASDNAFSRSMATNFAFGL